MKRSEMLEVIEVNISETKDQLNSYQLAERILKRILQLGMLPPMQMSKNGKPKESFIPFVDYCIRQWESEDDS